MCKYYVTSEWCNPCKNISKIIDELNQDGYIIKKLDISDKIANDLNVRGVPCYINDEKFDMGIKTKEDLIDFYK